MELRIIDSGPAKAATNMAVDRGIIEQVSADPTYAVLRWYTWDPPAFSLGYGQKSEHVFDKEKLERLGIPWVKRPTGGSLVYHAGDLSYSFTLPRRNPWGILSSKDLYRLVSTAWIKGLNRLGISAAPPKDVPAARDVPHATRQLCLAFHSPGDLLVKGKKIGGSAQRRLRNVWHQDGFFLLRSADPPDCLRLPEMAIMMKTSSGDLASLGYALEETTLRECLSEAMTELFTGAYHERRE